MDLAWLRDLDDEAKEQTYREFWRGERPGSVLVHASRYHREPRWPPRPPDLDPEDRERWFRYHLDCQLEQLQSRDWSADDALPSVVVPIGPTGTLATAFGSHYDTARDWTTQCLRSPEEVRQLRKPTLSDGLIGHYLEGVRYTADAVGEALPICFGQCLQGPLSTSSMILDDQVLLEAMYTHPKEVHRLLDMVTDLLLEFIAAAQRCLPRPVPTTFNEMYFPDGLGVCLADDLAAVVSPWLYEEFGVPYMNRISEAFGGLVLHSCGDPTMNLPVLRGIRNFRGLDLGATECSVPAALDAVSGSAVVAFHIGLNTAPHFPSRLACVEHVLRHARPNGSLFINASTYACGLPEGSWQEWNDESALIVERVRARVAEMA
jgi:hypothetical protein